MREQDRGMPRGSCASVINLGERREALRAPTYAALLLACAAGATVLSRHPGNVVVTLSEGHRVEHRVRAIDHDDEAVAALYARYGHAPPARLRRATT